MMKLLWSAATILLTNTSKAFPTPPSSHQHTIAQMSSTNNLSKAQQEISKAISIGAPAYNAGDIEKCANVYENTAVEIASLLPSSLQKKLLNEVESETNFDDKAWSLRRVFDSIIDYQMPLVPQQSVDRNISYEPYTPIQLGEAIPVMDNVMGGISKGSWVSKSNIFFGETSLANNGGFASIRWRFPTVQNWSYAKGIYIKGLRHSKPEEHTYSLILKDAACAKVRLANFKIGFANPDGGDGPLLIPFSVFDRMEQMGRVMAGAPSFSSMEVTEIGIMAIKPTVVGDFQLEFSEWGLYN